MTNQPNPRMTEAEPSGSSAPHVGLPAQAGMVEALQAWGRSALLIDSGLRVVCLNDLAQAHVGDGVLLSQNRLRARNRASDAALQALLAEACAAAASHRSTALALPRRQGRPLVVHCAALPEQTARIFGNARALVTLTTLERQAATGAVLLAQAYGLTPAEERLCHILASGAGLPEAARSLRVSISTVRTHLKGAFLKTETHRQSELVALMGQAAHGLWASPAPTPCDHSMDKRRRSQYAPIDRSTMWGASA